MTGEDLYQELCGGAERAGISLRAFVSPIYSNSWKTEQLRIAERPTQLTIERVMALVQGRPIPGKTYQPNADRLLPGHKSLSRLRAEAMGLPPSGRSILERRSLEIAQQRRQHEDTMRALSDMARDTRRPGQSLHERLRELRRELAA